MLGAADLHAAFAGPAALVQPEGGMRFVGLPPAPMRHAPAFLDLRVPHNYKGGDEEDDARRGRFDLRFPEARESEQRKNTEDRIPQARARAPPVRAAP